MLVPMRQLHETEYLPDRNKYLQLLPIENLAQAKQNDRDQWNQLIATDIVFVCIVIRGFYMQLGLRVAKRCARNVAKK